MSRNGPSRSILSEPAETRGADTLTLINVSLDMIEQDISNDPLPEESGEFLVLEEVEELAEGDFSELPVETTLTIDDQDIEELEAAPRQPVIRQVTQETVLIYCKPGETLPPYAVPTGELPRFATSERRRPLPRFEEQRVSTPSFPRLPAAKLPRFDLEAAAPARRVPPVLLPRFPITDPIESRRVPAVRASRAPAHTLDNCPHCRHLARMLARAC